MPWPAQWHTWFGGLADYSGGPATDLHRFPDSPSLYGRELPVEFLDAIDVRVCRWRVQALAPIVAFEHHLKQDLSGYPEKIGSRRLNLCTMIVSIADVFDALRSNRPYRQGLATNRIRAIMGEQGNPAFNQLLLKRFVNLMGLFPVGNLVRLSTDELAVVSAEHPNDPFRPQVKIIQDASGHLIEEPFLANTWERDSVSGEHERAVVEAVDPEPLGIDPLKYL